MFKSIVNVNKVPTEIISFNKSIEDELDEPSIKDIVIVITGNPGVPAFYKEFARQLQSKLSSKVPIWIIGHTGHTLNLDNDDYNLYPDPKINKNLYDLNGNLEHKIQFIKNYVPSEAKIHLIGHSIGAWFVMNLLKNNDIAEKVIKCYLLFPTFERMAETPNGRFFTNYILRIASVLIFLSWIFTFFPRFIQTFLIRTFGILYGIPKHLDEAVLQLIHPMSIKSAFFLGKHEMIQVKNKDECLISQHKKKLYFYYGSTDGWVPIRYYEDLKDRFPDVDAHLCKRNFKHAFVLKDSIEVGKMIGDMINDSISF